MVKIEDLHRKPRDPHQIGHFPEVDPDTWDVNPWLLTFCHNRNRSVMESQSHHLFSVVNLPIKTNPGKVQDARCLITKIQSYELQKTGPTYSTQPDSGFGLLTLNTFPKIEVLSVPDSHKYHEMLVLWHQSTVDHMKDFSP